MPVFSFVLVNGEREFPLRDGIELRDNDEALKHGQRAVQKVFQDEKLFDWFDWELSIRSENGEEVARTPIPDTAVDRKPRPRSRH